VKVDLSTLVVVAANKEATESRVHIGQVDAIRLKVLRKVESRHHDLVNRYGIFVSQMTTDMFHL
jgi:predicted NUDIX family phosphoesterase